jgi:hypothetical protein
MKLDIHIRVRLATGAEVTLTGQQKDKVETFVQNLIFGKQVKKRGKYRARLGRRRWTPEEISELKLAIKEPMTPQGRRQLAQKFGRTPGAVAFRAKQEQTNAANQ